MRRRPVVMDEPVPKPATPGAPTASIVVHGAVRGTLAAIAGLAVTALLALLLWTITPSSGSGPEPLLRGAVAAYVLAHFGSVQIGAATLTLVPLLLTLSYGLILVFSVGRGRVPPLTAAGEATWIGAGAVSYGVMVAVVATVLAPAGASSPLVSLWAALLAAVALGIGTYWRGTALRELTVQRIPGWCRVGLRGAGAASAALVAGAAAVVAVTLVVSFSRAAELTGVLAHGVGEGLALTLAAAGFLPNMVSAALGYLTGAGFQVGAGRYSPFGSVLADLPPFPLLAAVPSSAARSPIGLVLLAIPLAAGLLPGLVVMRRLSERGDRLRAVAIAAGVTGVLAGSLVALAAGGVTGGQWPRIGGNGWLVGLIVGLAVLVLSGVWVLAAEFGPAANVGVKRAGSRRGRRSGAARKSPAATDESEAGGTGDVVNGTDADAGTAEVAEADGTQADSIDPDRTDRDSTDPDSTGLDSDQADNDQADSSEADSTKADSDEEESDEADSAVDTRDVDSGSNADPGPEGVVDTPAENSAGVGSSDLDAAASTEGVGTSAHRTDAAGDDTATGGAGADFAYQGTIAEVDAAAEHDPVTPDPQADRTEH